MKEEENVNRMKILHQLRINLLFKLTQTWTTRLNNSSKDILHMQIQAFKTTLISEIGMKFISKGNEISINLSKKSDFFF